MQHQPCCSRGVATYLFSGHIKFPFDPHCFDQLAHCCRIVTLHLRFTERHPPGRSESNRYYGQREFANRNLEPAVLGCGAHALILPERRGAERGAMAAVLSVAARRTSGRRAPARLLAVRAGRTIRPTALRNQRRRRAVMRFRPIAAIADFRHPRPASARLDHQDNALRPDREGSA